MKRLNCTFAFSASQLSGITGGVWCPEMRWRVLSLNQMGMIVTIRRCVKRFLYLEKQPPFVPCIFSLYLSVHPSIYLSDSFSLPVCIMIALLSMFFLFFFTLGVFFMLTFLAQVVYLKFCQGATLDPCSHRRNK